MYSNGCLQEEYLIILCQRLEAERHLTWTSASPLMLWLNGIGTRREG